VSRRILTVTTIDDLLARGETQLELGPADIVTDLAREHARDRGLRLVPAGAGSPSATALVPPAAPAAPAAPADPAPEREAVRRAVIAELGREPEGLDAAIARVLDRDRT
jgi:hypothetical protein